MRLDPGGYVVCVVDNEMKPLGPDHVFTLYDVTEPPATGDFLQISDLPGRYRVLASETVPVETDTETRRKYTGPVRYAQEVPAGAFVPPPLPRRSPNGPGSPPRTNCPGPSSENSSTRGASVHLFPTPVRVRAAGGTKGEWPATFSAVLAIVEAAYYREMATLLGDLSYAVWQLTRSEDGWVLGLLQPAFPDGHEVYELSREAKRRYMRAVSHLARLCNETQRTELDRSIRLHLLAGGRAA